MKNNAILRIVLFCILLVVLVAILAVVLTGWMGARNYGQMYGMTVVQEPVENVPGEVSAAPNPDTGEIPVPVEALNTAEVSAAGVSEIKIEWVAGTVKVQPGDVESIRFSETEGDRPMAYFMDGDELVIRFMEGKWTDIVGSPLRTKKDLTVTVPRDWSGKELSIEAVEADVQVVDLVLEELDFDGVSGRFAAENCQVRELDMDTVSGNVSYSGSLQELDVDSVSADCVLNLSNVPAAVEMDGVSGNLEITLPENAGFSVRLQSAGGKLTTDFEGTRSGKSFVSGDGACRITLSGVSGNVGVYKGR